MIDRRISEVTLEIDGEVYYMFIAARGHTTLKDFEDKYGIVAVTNNTLHFKTKEHKTLFLMKFG